METLPAIPPTQEERGSTVLWLIRHAEVEERYQGIFGGTIDMALSPRGHVQAQALARYLQHKKFAALYASPMLRVQQTLAPLLGNGSPRPVVVPELREVNFGDWTGLSWQEVEDKFGVSAFDWLEQLECDGIANAECAEVLRERIEPWVARLLPAHHGEQVAVFCHGGVIRVILSILLAWPLPRLGAFEIDYASITQVVWTPPKSSLQLLNFAPWREYGA